MSEYIRRIGANLIERMIVAIMAAVITTYILTERQEGRIANLEKQVAEEKSKADKQEERCQKVAQYLERVATMVEIHMQDKNNGVDK